MSAFTINRWGFIQLFCCLFLISPIVMIIWVAFQPSPPLLAHLIDTVLVRYLSNTLMLMIGVAVFASIFGISSAWVVSRYEFTGRNLLSWLLVLPAAMPAYLIAYVYTDFLEYAGPVQTGLRDLMGYQSSRDYWFFEIRSMQGAIILMSAVLYPYVYIMARTAFSQTSRTLFEAAAISGRDAFYHVGLPLARPAIVAGLALVMMEVLADFGTVDYFAIETLTLGIFNVWLGMNNMPAAAQLSLFAFLVILLILAIELYARSRRSFQNLSNAKRGVPRIPAPRYRLWLYYLICVAPLLLGFVIPVAILLSFLGEGLTSHIKEVFLSLISNNFQIAILAAIASVSLSVVIGLISYFKFGRKSRLLALVASTGYAFPGTILAIGVLGFLGLVNQAASIMGLPYITGGILALLIGYMVRFHAVGYGAVQTGIGRVPKHIFEASLTLGKSFQQTIRLVVLPIMSPSIGAGLLLVFVDVMKELPMTLLLRPFNFETFATFTYQYAKDEMIAEAALPALMIVLAGLIPVILLTYSLGKTNR